MILVEWYLNSFLINSSFPFHYIVLFVSVHFSFLKVLLALFSKLPDCLLKLSAFIYGYANRCSLLRRQRCHQTVDHLHFFNSRDRALTAQRDDSNMFDESHYS